MKEGNNCENCGAVVLKEDDFCTDCGSILSKKFKCAIHPDIDAEGVCVICTEPYCKLCIGKNEPFYLCNKHSNYEIIEGFVRVYGSLVSVDADYISNVLKNENLHPFVFKREASPIHFGYENHSLFPSVTDKPVHSVNEYKVMLPFQELIKAESILKDIL